VGRIGDPKQQVTVTWVRSRPCSVNRRPKMICWTLVADSTIKLASK